MLMKFQMLLRMRIRTSLCLVSPTLIHYIEEDLNAVADSLCVTEPGLNPIRSRLTWGGGGFHPPWETFLNNSKTAQHIKMKFSKFNPTLMGVILHITAILIHLRCCHGNLLL